MENATNSPKCVVDTPDFTAGRCGHRPLRSKYSGFSTTWQRHCRYEVLCLAQCEVKCAAGFRRNFTAKQLHDAKLIFSCRQAHFVEKSTLSRAFFWWGRLDSLRCGEATGRQTCHWHVCLDGPFESVLRMPIPQKTTILWIVVFCGDC